MSNPLKLGENLYDFGEDAMEAMKANGLEASTADGAPRKHKHRVIDYKARAVNADATCRSLFPAYICLSLVIAVIPIVRGNIASFDQGEII